MNLILLEPGDFVTPTRVRLRGRRYEHVREVHRARVGDRLRVGRLDGPLGSGTVTALGPDGLELEVELGEAPPPPLPVTLAVALPRPPSVRKVLQGATALGVKRFVFFASARVEKSYWQSSTLRPAAIRQQLELGLEQARDTALPEVRLERDLERLVTGLVEGAEPIVLADPEATEPCPRTSLGTCTLVLGPEGGLLEHETARLEAAGARRVSLGPRVLRVETAVVALIARLS